MHQPVLAALWRPSSALWETTRRHAKESLEAAGQVGLVEEADLGGDVRQRLAVEDPIAGDHDGTYNMTVQHKPIKKTLHGLPRFTTVKGGAYILLPGLRALRSLGNP
jgi:hypothetical protein